MNPTLLYNNYHLQRRKMFENSPRNNLYSTVDFTWRQSLDSQMTPKQQMDKKKYIENRNIAQRSNELISKRLKKEVFLESDLWNCAKLDSADKHTHSKAVTIDIGDHRRNASTHHSINNQTPHSSFPMQKMKDTLNQQVQNYYSSNKFAHQKYKPHKDQAKNLQNKHQSPQNRYDKYTRHFDPELQSLASRQSMASSQLSELIPKGKGYLGSFLNKKLEKYLMGGRNSRDANFYDLQTIEHREDK